MKKNHCFSRIGYTRLWVFFLCTFFLFSAVAVAGQSVSPRENDSKTVVTSPKDKKVQPVCNVIVLIPDGCSLATVSAARWYQWFLNPDQPDLNIDPYLCGTVRTNCSNAPIGDSAPTTSCYMTGVSSRAGWVSTYPTPDGDNDIFPMDSALAYQPLMTVLEASRILYGKSTGLVFTCEFPHATPADCSAHTYNRGNYSAITSQMVHNQLDVVIGGGVKLLEKEQQQFLEAQGVEVQLDDVSALRRFTGRKLWSLFNATDMPYDIDRDPDVTPGLDEMTDKAIKTLKQNKKGFFLMVEGSKVDWAAHANEPVGMMTDFLAFDRACKVALDFAKADGNTAVLILPDHGNSGISIGSGRCPGYSALTKEQLFGAVTKYKRTPEGLASILKANEGQAARSLVKQYTALDLSDEQLQQLYRCSDYNNSPLPKQERTGFGLWMFLNGLMKEPTCFGFTTGGHTGEDVFLAAYHPKNQVPQGVYHNFEINDYLCKLLQLEDKLPGLTTDYFAKHTRVFQGMNYTSNASAQVKHPVLTVKNGTKTLEVQANSNVALLNGEKFNLSSVVIYVDKTETFYLPKSLAAWMK